jgi:hypothetical protein
MRSTSLAIALLVAACTSGDDQNLPDTDILDTDNDSGEDTGAIQYPVGPIHSPIPADIADVWRDILSTHLDPQPDVFMKVGASSTVSSRTLYCFAGDEVNLADYGELEDTWRYFLGGDAAGTSPFDRVTAAAKSGRTARWVMSGDPSPIEIEFDALSPSIALIHYGTNDMGMGSTYASAMPDFYDAMMDLLEWLIDRGVLPVLTAISHRGDRESANRWVHSYNTLLRGMAQGFQTPFLDLYHAMDPLDGHGLSPDGIHLNKGPYGTCDFAEEALAYGYNMRNLIALQTFDRVKQVLVDGSPELDATVVRLAGAGHTEDPFAIETLPFADHRSTLDATQRQWDKYDCDDADESGPEFVYALELESDTALRIMVMDRDDVDIDIHLLDVDFNCMARGHRQIDVPLTAGSYYITADTWVDGDGVERSGAYQLIVLECDAGELDCQ